MKFKDYVASQFDVKLITEGNRKGRVCFKTPLADYTLTPEVWEAIKEKLNEV